MGIAVFCVGSDAARVARALSAGRRRVSCTRLPPSPELVVRCAKQAPPQLVIVGGDAAKAAAVVAALADEPAAENTAVIAWGMEGTRGVAQLVALGAQAVTASDEALRRAFEELLDAREGRTVRVDSGTEEVEEGVSLHGRRVIVAEDHPAVAWYFGDTLRRAGCDVEEVSDGWDALDRARRQGADVVLADIRMPGLDGLRLCRALRMDPVLADVPVILLSWKQDWLARAREADVGATGYLGKHAVPQDVVESVREAVQRHVAFEARFRADGPVRGLLGDVSMHRLLRLASTSRPSSRITVQSSGHGFELYMRDGAPVSCVRVSSKGDELRGNEAFGALLSVRVGRFLVSPDRTKVKPELTGTLHQLAAPHVARAREEGPQPTPTPSIPIIVEPTQTVKVEVAADTSVPIELVKKAVAPPPVVKIDEPAPKRKTGVREIWKTMLRAVALAAVGAIAVALCGDSSTPPPPPAAEVTPVATPPVELAPHAYPAVRAERTEALHPR